MFVLPTLMILHDSPIVHNSASTFLVLLEPKTKHNVIKLSELRI